MVGGIRDVVLFGEWKLLLGFIAILVSVFIGNMILGYFNPGFAGQPIAHTDGLWNALGMALAGFCCVLLGGCPLRQLVLAGEGNSCPEPVIRTKNALASGEKAYTVMVDNVTARENVSRFALHQGYQVSVKEDGEDFILTLEKEWVTT